MSHATGAVHFEDGLTLWAEYNGSSSFMCSKLNTTFSEMWETNWRKDTKAECSCGQDEPVEMATSYADGLHWKGRACRHCMAVTDGRTRTGMTAITERRKADTRIGGFRPKRGPKSSAGGEPSSRLAGARTGGIHNQPGQQAQPEHANQKKSL